VQGLWGVRSHQRGSDTRGGDWLSGARVWEEGGRCDCAGSGGMIGDMIGGFLIAGLLFMAWAVFIAAMIKTVLWLLAA
jgi:hypothetical protein